MNQHVLTVKGKGRESFKPDQVTIRFTLSSKSADYGALTLADKEKLEELTFALTQVGFDKSEIKTASFNITTEYENFQDGEHGWKRRFTGYSLDRGLSLSFDFRADLLNSAVSAVSSCKKADPSFSITFDVRDKASASDGLLKKATEDAFRRAEATAKAAGIVLGRIESISCTENEPSFSSPTVFARAAGSAEMYRGTSGFDITPEDVVSEESVTVVWEIGG